MAPHPGTSTGEEHGAGQLSASISNAIVHLHREYLGRGPTKARTSIRDDTIVVVMTDTLTKAEHSLVADGKADEVLSTATASKARCGTTWRAPSSGSPAGPSWPS